MSSVSGSGERILAILDLFTEDRLEWSSEEMMAVLGYSRPTLYRYLKTLKDSGYLTTRGTSGYSLGPRVTELDFLMTRADPLISSSRFGLETLAERFPGSAFVVRWYGRKLLCVASVTSAEEPRSSYPRGRPMPLGRGAISRAIVAWLPPSDRRALIADHLREFSGAGVGDTVGEVLDALRDVRRAGVATAYGEVTPGVVGVAAPILVSENAPLGAVCLTSDEATIDEHRLAAISEAVRDIGREISQKISGESRSAPRADAAHARRKTSVGSDASHGGTL